MATSLINLNAFLPLVRPHAPGAALPSLTQALRLAAIEFCEQTRCWRHKTTLTVTRQDYPVVAPAYSEIHEIERAEFEGGVYLTPAEYSDLSFDDFEEDGVPSIITQQGPNTVSILPFQEGKLTCSVFLKPKHGDLYETDTNDRTENWYDTVPDFMLSRYGEAIAAGAASRVLMLPQQTFSDVNMAAVHRAKFDQAIDRVNSANLRGQHRARPRSHASWF